MSENKSIYKYVMYSLFSFILIAFVIQIIIGDNLRNDETNAKNSVIDNTGSIHNSIFKFTGGEDKMYIKDTGIDDNFFLQNEYVYNHNLAKASLALSLSAFSADDVKAFWGENGNYNREIHVKQLISDLNFEKTEFYGYDVNLNDSSSKVAFTLGHKSLKVNNLTCDVVCVAIRGGGYGCEWADNFKLGGGESPYHEGFLKSAQNVKENLDDYIQRRCDSDRIKLWITGYSRGGAVANILASLYDSDNNYENYEIYAYTFASPATVESSYPEFKKDRFNNIFNIINPYDIVPTIPPLAWGFSRFGVNMYFPKYTSEQNDLFEKVSSYYTGLTGNEKNLFEESPLKNVTDIIVKLSKDRTTYAKYFQPILEDLVLSSLTMEKNNDKWTVIPFKKFIEQKYGLEMAKNINSYKENAVLGGIGDTKIKLPGDFVNFLVLCEINGLTDISSVISESLTLGSAQEIAGLSGESMFSAGVSGHYPELYLAWMETIEEKEFIK